MYSSVSPTCEATTTVVSAGSEDDVMGIVIEAKVPSATRVRAMRYQVLRFSVVSTMGAQRNFHACGAKAAATTAPIASTQIRRSRAT